MSEGEAKAPEGEKKKDCTTGCTWKDKGKSEIPGCPIRRGLSEEEFGKKWDICAANTAVKTAAGLGIGAIASLVLFRRRPWPLIFGGAFGLGVGVGNCKSLLEPGSCHRKVGASCPAKKSTDPDQSKTVAPVDAEKH